MTRRWRFGEIHKVIKNKANLKDINNEKNVNKKKEDNNLKNKAKEEVKGNPAYKNNKINTVIDKDIEDNNSSAEVKTGSDYEYGSESNRKPNTKKEQERVEKEKEEKLKERRKQREAQKGIHQYAKVIDTENKEKQIKELEKQRVKNIKKDINIKNLNDNKRQKKFKGK